MDRWTNFTLKMRGFSMNFRYISLMVLISVSPILAMNYSGQDPMNPQSKAATRLHAVEQHAAAQCLIAQGTRPKSEQRAQAEKEQEPKRVAVLADAFSKLPNNKSRSEKEQKDFYAMIAARMPKAVQGYIGEFQGKSSADFIDKHLMELIPCVIQKHGYYSSMRKLVADALERLIQRYNDQKERLEVRERPYIIATAGFWSFDEPNPFNDAPSQFRYRSREMQRGFASDLAEWFQSQYPNNPVKPLGDDGWLAVLYSDGSIQWKISPLNKARLKKLTKEQLLLGIALWEQPDFLKESQLAVYRSLPAYVAKVLQSNYEIASCKQDKHVRRGLQGLACAGLGLAAAYWIYKGLGETIHIMRRPNSSWVSSTESFSRNGVTYTRITITNSEGMMKLGGRMLAAYSSLVMPIAPLGIAALHTQMERYKFGRDRFSYRADNSGYWYKTGLPIAAASCAMGLLSLFYWK